jgi:hypothetical protein
MVPCQESRTNRDVTTVEKVAKLRGFRRIDTGSAELKAMLRAIMTTAVALFVAFASPAYGYCQAPRFFPRAPSAPGLYERPDLPDCLSKHPSAGQVTCEPSEAAAYAAEVARYAARLRRYADEVSRFATEATTFVENAESYVSCEAADIGVQPDQLEDN